MKKMRFPERMRDDLRPEYDLSKLKPADRSKYPRYLMVRTVSSKGQVTLPAEIRERMGLGPGSEVSFELTPAGTLIRKSRTKR